MPVSRSPSPAANKARPPARKRSYWPLVLVGLLTAIAFVIVALPAALVPRFLPPSVQAADLSGSIWHGSMGKITVSGRDAGSLEWRLHPASLVTLAPTAELHWVKAGFVVDGTAQLDRRAIHASAIRGGGPVDDLADLGVPPGVHGSAEIALREIASDYSRITAVVGDVEVSDATSAQIGDGSPLGNYVLHFGEDAVAADGSVTGNQKDLGGPFHVQGILKISPAGHVGTVSATVGEGAGITPAMRSELNSLAQMRGRDRYGRIPVDLEFTF